MLFLFFIFIFFLLASSLKLWEGKKAKAEWKNYTHQSEARRARSPPPNSIRESQFEKKNKARRLSRFVAVPKKKRQILFHIFAVKRFFLCFSFVVEDFYYQFSWLNFIAKPSKCGKASGNRWHWTFRGDSFMLCMHFVYYALNHLYFGYQSGCVEMRISSVS